MKTLTKEDQAAITPNKALEMLRNGNKRFVENRKENRDHLEQVKQTSSGQHPFAVVLSCIDSRVPAELVFDQGIGDIFSVRIAGNIVNEDILGSIEFACKVAGSKIVVVLGHSSCGAVKGACDDVKLGNLTGMLQKIRPAVESVDESGDRSSANDGFVQKVADKNVEVSMQEILKKSPVLKEMLEKQEIGIVGGMYYVDSGEVRFGEMHHQ